MKFCVFFIFGVKYAFLEESSFYSITLHVIINNNQWMTEIKPFLIHYYVSSNEWQLIAFKIIAVSGVRFY
jgi:hypothetical protein